MSEIIAADLLRQLIERIERLEEEKRGIMEDIKEVFSEVKAQGFDVKAVKAVIKLRNMEQHKRQEMEAILDSYLAALGMAE